MGRCAGPFATQPFTFCDHCFLFSSELVDYRCSQPIVIVATAYFRGYSVSLWFRGDYGNTGLGVASVEICHTECQGSSPRTVGHSYGCIYAT